MKKSTHIVKNYAELERRLHGFLTEIRNQFKARPEKPLIVSWEEAEQIVTWRKHKEVQAHLRDIARWRYGSMTVPERVFENVVDDFKKSEIWPKQGDPEPDYFTGELLYRPVSRTKLTQQQAQGIINWLVAYMGEHQIPSHAPTENWQIPEDAA